MIFIWTILLLQLITSLNTNEKEMSVSSLSCTFRYDFKQLPNIGAVLVWRIAGDPETILKPRKYETQIPQFKYNRTYLLFTQIQHGFKVYYWLGRSALLDDKKATAKYALMQYLLFSAYTSGTMNGIISREEEYTESESFLNTINFINTQNLSESVLDYYRYLDKQLPLRLPNLYVLRGGNTTRIKQVSFSTQWLKKDICLLLVSGYRVDRWMIMNTYCGPDASQKMRGRTKHFDNVLTAFYKKRTHFSNVREPLSRDDQEFKTFVEVLEDFSNWRPSVVDDAEEHLEDAQTFVTNHDNNISLHQICDDQIMDATTEINKHLTIFFFYPALARVRGCHLFDSASVSGLFLFIHGGIKHEEKLKAIQLAEKYLHEKYSSTSGPTRMRIIHYERLMHYMIDFTINLLDWPPNRELIRANENW